MLQNIGGNAFMVISVLVFIAVLLLLKVLTCSGNPTKGRRPKKFKPGCGHSQRRSTTANSHNC